MNAGRRIWAGFCLLFFIFLPPIPCAASDRITIIGEDMLHLSYPRLDDNFIVWSGSDGTHIRGWYIDLSSSNFTPSQINKQVQIVNTDKVAVDQGVVIYRSDDKKLYCTNLSPVKRWGLRPHESRVLVDTIVSVYFQIRGDLIVYLEGEGFQQKCYLLREDALHPQLLFQGRAKDLCLYKDDQMASLVWKNTSTGDLWFIDLNNPGSQARDLKAEAGQFGHVSLWGDRVVYSSKAGATYLCTLKDDFPKSRVLDCNGPICLWENNLYYVSNGGIYVLDISTGKTCLLVEEGAASISTNGSDLVWKKFISNGFLWYAGVQKVEILLEDSTVEIGDQIKLRAMATYKNGSSQEVSDTVYWTTNDSSILQISGSDCRAVAAGTARITAVYEGMSCQRDLTVTGLQGLEIFPNGPVFMEQGQTQEFVVNAVYSHNTVIDVTNRVTWESELGNPIRSGIYAAAASGEDQITASYNGLCSTVKIFINTGDAPPPLVYPQKIRVFPQETVVKVGEKVEFSAEVDYSDDSCREVSKMVAWTVGDPEIISLQNNIVIGLKPGKTWIMADYSGLSARAWVQVQPVNTTGSKGKRRVYQQPSPWALALRNSPANVVEVIVDPKESGAAEFVLDRETLSAIGATNKNLRIVGSFFGLDLGPDFARQVTQPELYFTLKEEGFLSGVGQFEPGVHGHLTPLLCCISLRISDKSGAEMGGYQQPFYLLMPLSDYEMKGQKLGVYRLNSEGGWDYQQEVEYQNGVAMVPCFGSGSYAIIHADCRYKGMVNHWGKGMSNFWLSAVLSKVHWTESLSLIVILTGPCLLPWW